MTRVLVTGATGFIGRQLVRELVAHGHEVRALVRDPGRAAGLAVELVRGDVTEPASLAAALEGVDAVVHLAAIYDFGVDAAWMREVNVEGTRHLLDAAAAAGIPRIVYGGSDTSLGDTRGALADEAQRPTSEPRSAYERTKREAHALVVERSRGGAPIVNAVISTVCGPGDPSAMGELIDDFVSGRLPVVVDGDAGYTFAHVDDVARGLRLALEQGAPGESYLISGTPASFTELTTTLGRLTGLAPPPSLTARGRRWVTPLLPWLGVFLGKPPAKTRELVAMATGVTRYFSHARARAALGWQPRGLADTLRDALAGPIAAARTASARAVGIARLLLVGLAVFDIALGGGALLAPGLYQALMHPAATGAPPALLARTGALWLFFAAVELLAATRTTPLLLMAVGLLRLLDVPADLVYLASAGDLGRFGVAALVFSPAFNLLAGMWLVSVGKRALRSEVAVRVSSSPPA